MFIFGQMNSDFLVSKYEPINVFGIENGTDYQYQLYMDNEKKCCWLFMNFKIRFTDTSRRIFSFVWHAALVCMGLH